MNNKHLFAAMLALPLAFAGFTTAAEDTKDIMVIFDFDFRIDRDMQLNLTSTPAGTGVVNVYYDYEYHDAVNNIYYPDQKTRVLNFKTSTINQVKFQARKSWQYLILEYVPTDANGSEKYKKVDLNWSNNIDVAL